MNAGRTSIATSGAAGKGERVHFTYRGRIDCESFAEFARHRAGRLDLAIELGACDTASMALAVAGPTDLIDAFEMACSLGPYACTILDVARSDGR